MVKLKSLAIVAGLVFAAGLVGVQASQAPKKVKKQISLSEDVKVGSTLLKKGKYEVASNDKGELSFHRMVQDRTYPSQWLLDMDEKPVVVKASATVLPEKSNGTQLDIVDNAGVNVLKSITLDDTNIKFTIEQ
jgi:hypothetical protein